jgi:protein transport protein SEC24
MKNATDIELAGVDSLKSFMAVLKHDGNLDEREDSFIQAAMLYTTGDGHRRVRVHNLSLSSASQLSLVFRQASLETTMNVLARQMIQKAMSSSMTQVHDFLTDICCKILVSYRSHVAAPSSSGQLILPETFKLFPVFAVSLLKTRTFKIVNTGGSDLRVYSMRILNGLGVGELACYLYPSLYDCTDLVPGIGTQNENGIVMFPNVRSSKQRLDPSRIYILGF